VTAAKISSLKIYFMYVFDTNAGWGGSGVGRSVSLQRKVVLLKREKKNSNSFHLRVGLSTLSVIAKRCFIGLRSNNKAD
jgi:hypothetical protein